MKNKISTVVFIVMQIFLVAYMIMLFTVPLRTSDINFGRIYTVETKEKADNILNAIRKNNIQELEHNFDANIENVETGLAQLNDFFIQNNLIEAQLVDVSFESFTSIVGDQESFRRTNFVYDISLERGYGILYIDIVETIDRIEIITLRIDLLENPMAERHRFYGMPMNSTRVFFLLFSFALMLFIMYTEFDYYKRIKNRKIWFQIIMPISAIAFSMNWNTLAINVSALTFNITPISLFSPGIMGEWRFTLYIPIIAVLYWVVFRKRIIDKERNNLQSEHIT
jgi:hypothetical protein